MALVKRDGYKLSNWGHILGSTFDISLAAIVLDFQMTEQLRLKYKPAFISFGALAFAYYY